MAKAPKEEKAPTAAAAPAAKPTRKKEFRKKREKKHVPIGIVYIQATFNNTLVTVTDPNGNVVAWSSAGSIGFKGSRKGTPFAAGQAAGVAAARAREMGMRTVEVRVKGPGSGRESAIRALASAGLQVTTLKDVTPIPHNGCRPPKRRRV
ncbi:MAG: 30S ribosomal protein S11 [Acidobacteria bacterium]|nr:30S ribosomal protein S11 [Acidobacteriota bacterium]